MMNCHLLRNIKSYIPITLLSYLWGMSAVAAPLVFDGPANFSDVLIGQTKKLSVTVKNKSRSKMRLDSYWFENGDGFRYEEGSCKMDGHALSPSKTCNFSVIFSPTKASDYQGRFVLGYFKGSGWRWAESKLDLSGKGVEKEVLPPIPAPTKEISLNILNSNDLVAETGKGFEISFELKNPTVQKIRVDETWFTNSAGTLSLKSTTCTSELLAGKTCSYLVSFHSQSDGKFNPGFVVGYYPGDTWSWKEVQNNFTVESKSSSSPPPPPPTEPPTTTPAEGRLHVSLNKILDSQNREVVLKGVNIADPEHLNVKENERPGVSANSVATMAVQDYYAKVVRLPILPGDPNYPKEGWFGPLNGGENYFQKHIDPLVKSLTSQKIYVIIDLHYISNYTGLYSKVAEFWKFMAPKYKDNPYVIYEIMNEPILPDNWDQFKSEIAAPTVALIRKVAPENLVIVGSPYWSSHLQGIVDNPIESNNIIYSAHIYSNQRESIWEKNYGEVISKFPVMITEWGFETGGTEGGDLDFGVRFEKWMNSHNLSWTAWCFDNNWGPRMFDKNWNLLGGNGGMGEFVKEKLIENNNRSVANTVE